MRKVSQDLPQVPQQEGHYYGPPRAQDYSADKLAQAAREMQVVLREWPKLTSFGFREPNALLQYFGPAADETFRQEREQMLSDDYLAAFLATRKWLRANATSRNTPNPHATSYGMKHRVERETGYITNGVFIAAAVAEGYTVKQEGFPGGRKMPLSPNAAINIDLRPLA